MEYSDKSKDELIKELQDLQNKYNSIVASYEKDIIVQKQTETALKKSQLLLNETGKISKVGGWEFDVKTFEQIWTDEIFNILEIDISHGTPKVEQGIQFFAPSSKQIGEQAVQRAIEYGEPYDLEAEIITTKRNYRWVRTIGKANYDNGKIVSVSGIFQDITERKEFELKLQKSKDIAEENSLRLSMAQKASNTASWDWDIVKNTFFWSAEFLKIYGLPDDTIAGFEAWEKVLHPDDLEIAVQRIKDSISNHTELLNDYRIILPDKTIRWIRSCGKTIYEENNPIRMVGLCIDITSHKTAEQELIQAKEKAEENEIYLRSVLQSFDDVIVSRDLYDNAVFFNRAFELVTVEIFNQSAHIGLNTLKLLPDEHRQFWENTLNKVKNGEESIVEYDFKTPGNTTKYYITSHKPITNGSKIVGTLEVTKDISLFKQREVELKTAKEHAEESGRLKTAFLQNMSHEIRTPMNAIMGFSELLIHNYNNKTKLEKFTKIINHRCTDLLVIIDDILDIARIESGQLSFNIEKCRMNSLFDDLKILFTEHQHKLNKQHIKLVLPAHSEPDLILETDSVKLKQIFINLIGNAFKFTNNGVIEAGYKTDANNLIFFVSDTGIGIPGEKQQLIFERFVQVDPYANRLYGGNGLGLSIVKGLVEIFGGKIWLESELNKGSTFYFSLPGQLERSSEELTVINKKKSDEIFLPNKTILVVEDDTYNAAFINEILIDKGLTILFTHLGIEAVRIATTQAIDLVLMDIGLPDISGYEAIHQIKQLKPNLKIIAQTAYAATSDKQKALDAGCLDYISKPLKPELLVSIIKKHLL